MAFKKGQSGNPNGRPTHKLKDGRSIAEVAREHTDKAVKTLVELLDADGTPAAARIAAATTLLDRGWGRPSQSLDVNANLSGNLNVTNKESRDAAVAAAMRADG